MIGRIEAGARGRMGQGSIGIFQEPEYTRRIVMNKRVVLFMVAILLLLAGTLGPTGSGVRAADLALLP